MRLDPGFLACPMAHRALHERARTRPENSLAAVRAAVDAGYGIEIDLQLSADGQAMVFHDYDLGRLTHETGAIRQRTAEDLGRCLLRDGGGAAVPRLVDVLEAVAGAVPLLIEIKDQDGALGRDVGALEAACLADLRGYAGPVAVMSFNPHSVAQIAELAPDMPRGLVTDDFRPEDWPTVPEARRAELRPLGDVDRLKVDFISHRWRVLDSPPVAAIKAQGLPVLCWTVRSPAEAAEALRIANNVTFEGYLP